MLVRKRLQLGQQVICLAFVTLGRGVGVRGAIPRGKFPVELRRALKGVLQVILPLGIGVDRLGVLLREINHMLKFLQSRFRVSRSPQLAAPALDQIH